MQDMQQAVLNLIPLICQAAGDDRINGVSVIDITTKGNSPAAYSIFHNWG